MSDYASIGGWHWQYTVSTLTLLGIVTLAILARDLIRDRREKQRMAAELEAGRAVQQVLIPEEIPTIPGFNIQSVYKPYGEVGGDFFQVLPVKSGNGVGGVLVIIGDVSGKGMPAAMTVSLLVGTVRTLAHLHAKPRRDSGRHEPTHAGPQPRRIHHLPCPPRRSERHTDHRQCRPHRALSWRQRAVA